MGILSLIVHNWRQGPESAKFPNRPKPAPGFRGPVVVDPGLCLTCGICEDVCVSAAIEVVPGEASGTWTYDPGRCTFCGACVRHCPVQALHQESDIAPAYVRPGETDLRATVPYPACAACGRPTLPHTSALINRAYPATGHPLPERASLCPDCRQRASVAAMKKSFENLA